MNTLAPKNCPICQGNSQTRRILKKFSNKSYGHCYCRKCGITFDSNVNDFVDAGVSAEVIHAIKDESSYRELFVETSRISDEQGNIYPDFEWADNESVKIGVAHYLIRSIEKYHEGVLDSIVDVGCGDGFSSLLIARRFPNSQVTAIDPSPLIERLLSVDQGTRVKPIRGTLQTTELDDGSADVVCIMGNLMLHLDPFDSIRHAFRILRPGGTLVIDFKNVRSLSRILARWFLMIGFDRWVGRSKLERNFVNMRYGFNREYVVNYLETFPCELLAFFDKPPRLLGFSNQSKWQAGFGGGRLAFS
ncbi:methyltransferase domain-containing protein [Thiococcus pfennigii]|uniref:methyltransferase domain-containing protein n=1 Tax=Thiococcus pfennigii TaxID=1057 RepID=UPI001903CFD1|nr:methyltransferase domain-containing protein [Thiococcus pfennigii]MBK1732622.1 hypothetical protein [Thiococcus pfennigii]